MNRHFVLIVLDGTLFRYYVGDIGVRKIVDYKNGNRNTPSKLWKSSKEFEDWLRAQSIYFKKIEAGKIMAHFKS